MTNNAIRVITPAFRIQTFEATGVFSGVCEIIASIGTITIAGSSDPTSLKAPGKRVRFHLPSTENARKTLPGMPFAAYPELTKSIPPAMAGPGPFREPPRAGTLFTVS